jgi:hypothetical protein
MRIPATPIKPYTRHVRVDQRRAAGSAPGISPVAPVDGDGRCRASTPMRPEDSLRGVVCDPDAPDSLAESVAV